MRLSDLTNETKKLAVIYKTTASEFTVIVEYRTSAVTLAFLSELQEQTGFQRVVYQVLKIVSSWDLTDDAGKVIPVTKEAIENNNMPYYLLSSILDAVSKDRFALSDESKNA